MWGGGYLALVWLVCVPVWWWGGGDLARSELLGRHQLPPRTQAHIRVTSESHPSHPSHIRVTFESHPSRTRTRAGRFLMRDT